MNTKRLLKTLLIASVTFCIAGCGDSANKNTLPDTLKVKQLSKTYVITGIGLSGSNKVAIINNMVVKPGMELDPGVTLKDVQPTYAIILHGNTEHMLRPESIQNELDKKKR